MFRPRARVGLPGRHRLDGLPWKPHDRTVYRDAASPAGLPRHRTTGPTGPWSGSRGTSDRPPPYRHDGFIMNQMILLRHGETEWSRAGRHTGRTDLPLTDKGEDQARALAPTGRGPGFDLVLVSPAPAGPGTAELAGLKAYETEPDLWEWDYGGYEGITTGAIRETRPGWSLWRDGVVPGDDEHPGETRRGRRPRRPGDHPSQGRRGRRRPGRPRTFSAGAVRPMARPAPPPTAGSSVWTPAPTHGWASSTPSRSSSPGTPPSDIGTRTNRPAASIGPDRAGSPPYGNRLLDPGGCPAVLPGRGGARRTARGSCSGGRGGGLRTAACEPFDDLAVAVASVLEVTPAPVTRLVTHSGDPCPVGHRSDRTVPVATEASSRRCGSRRGLPARKARRRPLDTRSSDRARFEPPIAVGSNAPHRPTSPVTSPARHG